MIDAPKDSCIMPLPMPCMMQLIIVWPDVVLFLPRLLSPEFPG